MKMTDLFLADLEREAPVTRRALENVPDGVEQWKPHPKSMPFGYLATFISTLPSWIVSMIDQDSVDLNPPGGKPFSPPILGTARELVAALDDNVRKAQEALRNTTDEHLMTTWRLLVGGKVVSELARHVTIRDNVFHHLAHHRGQLTVYLRLNDAKVPSIYGPTADEPM